MSCEPESSLKAEAQVWFACLRWFALIWRSIQRFSNADITGVTINDYQASKRLRHLETVFEYLKAYAWQPGAGQASLAPCWPYVGPMLAHVGPMLAHVEPSWELCWGHVWAIYVVTPPPGAQNHVKTKVFEYRPDDIPCRRRARNTVKKWCFFNTASKNNVNYRGFSRGGVVWRWVGFGYQPKASGKDTGWPVTTFGLWCGKIGPRFSAQMQEGLCWTEAGIMRSACLYGSSLGLRWAQVVPKSGPCWAILGLSWAYVGPSRAPILGLCCAKLGPCWAMLGPSWPHVGPMLAYVGPMLAHVEPSWELCWGNVWAIYVETILRCSFFPQQNHVTTEVL